MTTNDQQNHGGGQEQSGRVNSTKHNLQGICGEMATRKLIEKATGGKQGDHDLSEVRRVWCMKCPPDSAQDDTTDLGATLEWLRVSGR